MKQIKTLVVHPDDRSTDFLKVIYAGLPNCNVMTSGTIWEIDLAIQAADQVILLGHGTKHGLLSLNKFKGGMYCIDHQSAPLLHGKKVIGIWCYCSDYMKEHGIENCFSSGMFISEVLEANYCGLPGYTKDQIDQQCMYFCDLVAAGIDLPTPQLYDFVNDEFGEAALYCKITDYNHRRLHVA